MRKMTYIYFAAYLCLFFIISEKTPLAAAPVTEKPVKEEERIDPPVSPLIDFRLKPEERKQIQLDDIQIFGSPDSVTIHRDGKNLPDSVKQRVDQLIKASKAGDIEALKSIIDLSNKPFIHSFDAAQNDPIQYWKEFSGDGEGLEMLAILFEILSSGYAIRNPGTDQEMYIWPYLSEIDVDSLTPAQLVELFTIITAGEYLDMRDFGRYVFFKVGIDSDGNWLFFVAGQ